jgi:hypothetical protein
MSTSFLLCMVIAVTALVFWRATLVVVAAALIAILITGIGAVTGNIHDGAEPTRAHGLTTPDASMAPTPSVPAPGVPTEGASPTAVTSPPR